MSGNILTGDRDTVSLTSADSSVTITDLGCNSFDLAVVVPPATKTWAEVLTDGNTSGATDAIMTAAQAMQFRDTNSKINSPAPGELDVIVSTKLRLGGSSNADVDLGITAQSTVSALKPLTTDKFDLGTNTLKFNDAFLSGTLNAATGIITKITTGNVSNPPTDAEITTEMGTAASAGAGFVGVIDDNAAGLNVWIVISDGTNWHYNASTKAV